MTPSETPLLEINAVGKYYGGFAALDEVSLSIPSGTYVTLLGPSGSGKTTLLSILGGFVEPSSGQILLDGEDVTFQKPSERATTTVFQDYALFPHMSVAANVGFGLKMKRLDKSEVKRQTEEALELTGLGGFGSRAIGELSGGQRQRVALARALVVKPKVLLLDEPLGALDMHLRWRMQEELWRLQRETGAVFVHVTHDQEEAMNLGDFVCVLHGGKIEDMGPPSRVYLHPKSSFTASFMGESNKIAGRIVKRGSDGVTVDTPLGTFACDQTFDSDDAEVMFRPEKVTIMNGDARPDSPRVEVIGRSFQGSEMKLWARSTASPDVEIMIKTQNESQISEGDTIAIDVPSDAVLLFKGSPEQ